MSAFTGSPPIVIDGFFALETDYEAGSSALTPVALRTTPGNCSSARSSSFPWNRMRLRMLTGSSSIIRERPHLCSPRLWIAF